MKNSNVPAIIAKPPNGDYTTGDKQIAILFMEYTAQEVDGIFQPRWDICENSLAVHKRTLREWWQKRKEILKASGMTDDVISEVTATKLKYKIIEAVNELDRRGFRKFTDANIIRFIKDMTSVVRLHENKSTENVLVGGNICVSHIKKK